ncbi:hypothetical protein MMC22_008091 [Lobaria immixta]|nr:hypothetical protein [Lobaria immixta]
MLNLTIDRSINRLMYIPLRLRMLKYVADPGRSLEGAYMMAEGEWKQLEAEKDLMVNMKAAKELELWRRMKLTIEENGRNVNSPLVQASLSRTQLLIADLHQVETHQLRSPPTLPYCAETYQPGALRSRTHETGTCQLSIDKPSQDTLSKEERKHKEKPNMKPKNGAPSVTSHQGKVQVELEDDTLEEVEDLLLYMNNPWPSIEHHCMKARRPTEGGTGNDA